MRGFGFGMFGVVATGLHLGGFYMVAPEGAAQAGGSQGADQLTLVASRPQMQAMVQRWQTLPDVADTLPTLAAQPAPPLPEVSVPKQRADPVALPSVPQITRIDPVQDQALDTTPAIAPPPPAPEPAPKKPEPDVAKPAPKAPAPKAAVAKPAATPVPKKRASGNGAAAQQSTGSQLASQSLSKSQIASLQSRWGAQIYSKIRRNTRPPRGNKDAGTAKLALTVGRNGRLQGVRLLRSSGSAALDQAALKAVKRAGRFAKAPKGLTKPSISFSIDLTFSK